MAAPAEGRWYIGQFYSRHDETGNITLGGLYKNDLNPPHEPAGFTWGVIPWEEYELISYDTKAEAQIVADTARWFRYSGADFRPCQVPLTRHWDFDPVTRSTVKPFFIVDNENSTTQIAQYRDNEIKEETIEASGISYNPPRSPTAFQSFRSIILMAQIRGTTSIEKLTHRAYNGVVHIFHDLETAAKYVSAVDVVVLKHDIAADLTIADFTAVQVAYNNDPTDENVAAYREFNFQINYQTHLIYGITEILTGPDKES